MQIAAPTFAWLGNGAVLGVPNPILLMVVLFVAAHLLMTRTMFGRYVYVVGGNPEAARLSGVPVTAVLLAVYCLCGAFAGLAGIVDASRFEGGRPNAGELYELQVIAAVVVGGASLAGGRGRVSGTLIGAMIIAVIQNGLNIAGVASYEQKVVFGALILAAVLLGRLQPKISESGRKRLESRGSRRSKNPSDSAPCPLRVGIASQGRRGEALARLPGMDRRPVALDPGSYGLSVGALLRLGFRPLATRCLVALALLSVPAPAGAQNTELTPSPDDPDVTDRSEAKYTITFTGAWTTTVTPGGLPGGAHFSRLIGGVHNDQAVFLESGETASAGVESMAEIGGYTTLRNEINAAGANRLSVIQGTTDNIGPTATRTFTDVTLSTDHPRVTLVTMIAPSPDWFVGVSGLSMLESAGDWKASVSVDLYPWDGGTEDGTEFSLSNSVTNPQGNITSIRNTGKFNDNKIATLTFTRTSVLTSAPTIGAVHPGDEALTVVWDAPTGVSDITAYDLRWILTSRDETVESNWTVVDDAWTEGDLHHVLTGLTDGSGYDVQARAVTATDGSWSATVAGTPSDPGATRDTATNLPLDVPLGGELDSTSDIDYFKFTLTAETGVLLFSRGELDTYGALHDGDGNLLRYSFDAPDPDDRDNFLIWGTRAAGTYYLLVEISPFSTKTGAYTVQARTLPDTTGVSDAHEVDIDGFEYGLIHPQGDEDYFKFTLGAETDLLLTSGTLQWDTAAELLDSNSMSIEENDNGWLLGGEGLFVIRQKLAAGAYYVKVGVPSATEREVNRFHVLYSLDIETVTEPGSDVAGAQPLDFFDVAAGRIDPTTDTDYFKIDLTEASHVHLRAVSNSMDIDGALADGDDAAVAANVFDHDFPGGAKGFTLSDRLAAGTHYLKVTRSGGDSTGGYVVYAYGDSHLDGVFADCSAIQAPFSDPLSGCQWHLRNRGQAGGTSGEDIRVEEVWTGGNMGAGVGVAVVDTGLHESHPDLTDNVDTSRGHDYTGNWGGPFYPFLGGVPSHGTGVAGVIAARDNNLGGRGVAPRATIYGYNLLLSTIDANEADAMTRNMATTGVSNNSWGETDGPGLDSASSAWEMAVDTGVTSGYDGKGVLYVWAVGNGGEDGDNSNFNGRTNYFGVVTVCAVTDRGRRAAYSEQGASLWVCAPSGGGAARILTTANFGGYTNSFKGTSAGAASVSGVAALVRAANANLTWRDVKLILAGSARKNHSSHGGWRTGASKYGTTGNYSFNHDYGFGVVDAKAAVDLAADWDNLPTFLETNPVEATPNLSIPDASGGSSGATQSSTVTVGAKVEFIEFVEVSADFDATAFRDLKVELVSPANTLSTLATSGDYADDNGNTYGIDPDFRFGSAAHLGENPAGTWTLRVTDEVEGNTATLTSWSVKIYGHRSRPEPPTISAVGRGQRALTVLWAAPGSEGASAVTSYDVRTIRSDAMDKADNRWTVVEGAWMSGALSYTVSGLLDLTQYDVQVRAVNDKGAGGWSATMMQETLPNRAPSAVGSITGPDLQVGDGSESVEVLAAFEDPEDDALTYGASSSAPAVAGASASGSRVTLTPVGRGTAAITVTATDVAGSNMPAEQRFNVRVKGRRGVTLSRDALSVDEGSTKTYTVVLDSEPTGDVTVTPVVPANRNLSVVPTEVEFSTGDGQTPKFVTVEADTDANTNSEPPVTITHRVSGADYGSVTAASVRVTIVETDTSVLSVEAAQASESAGTVTFDVTLSRASASEITVDYATSNGSAQAGSDYTAANDTLTFPASATASQQIVVDITDDDVDEEEEETFRLMLSNARHASLAGGGSTLRVLGTIEDDDDPEVEVSFGSASYGVTEGGTTNVVVRLDRDPERDLDIFLEEDHHGGTTDADYSGVPQSVTFGPGVRTQEFLFAATDDTTDDDGESVVLSFSFLPPRVSGDGETTIAINDNDGSGGPGGPGSPGGGGGGPPPSDDDEEDDGGDDGGGVGGGGGGPPPRAMITVDAECENNLCRARAGVPVTFEDTSTGFVRFRRWEFGDGSMTRTPRSLTHAWSAPGFYEVTLWTSNGRDESTASLTFLVEASDPAGTCEPDARTLCLQDSRFSVRVDWRTGDQSGSASVVHGGTNDSGMFWFFNPDNWEVLIKVLDGCALNGHVWVFGASTTDLGYSIRVTDTVTGVVREYGNEPGLPAPAITDSGAFPGACAAYRGLQPKIVSRRARMTRGSTSTPVQ